MARHGPEAATIEVELCGKLAELHGRLLALSVPGEGCTAGIVLARAAEAVDGLAPMVAEGRVRVCINEVVVSDGAAVGPGDRVALFPPVSGG
ncbi:MoaD/ThiS family protein [Tsuneonella sp. YG55]|uniref:MoaD/ThiS family protein n=1 Tax=Tsuneonella litorea TaxID=2976475 RepID=A0A9X2W1A1_9SPHN|nr:MoaD/ThiS family protein [Tsuneonella litorea]MCT2558966.1 MoaD/ThiS family protein [Tsuneonella litorea]